MVNDELLTDVRAVMQEYVEYRKARMRKRFLKYKHAEFPNPEHNDVRKFSFDSDRDKLLGLAMSLTGDIPATEGAFTSINDLVDLLESYGFIRHEDLYYYRHSIEHIKKWGYIKILRGNCRYKGCIVLGQTRVRYSQSTRDDIIKFFNEVDSVWFPLSVSYAKVIDAFATNLENEVKRMDMTCNILTASVRGQIESALEREGLRAYWIHHDGKVIRLLVSQTGSSKYSLCKKISFKADHLDDFINSIKKFL